MTGDRNIPFPKFAVGATQSQTNGSTTTREGGLSSGVSMGPTARLLAEQRRQQRLLEAQQAAGGIASRGQVVGQQFQQFQVGSNAVAAAPATAPQATGGTSSGAVEAPVPGTWRPIAGAPGIPSNAIAGAAGSSGGSVGGGGLSRDLPSPGLPGGPQRGLASTGPASQPSGSTDATGSRYGGYSGSTSSGGVMMVADAKDALSKVGDKIDRNARAAKGHVNDAANAVGDFLGIRSGSRDKLTWNDALEENDKKQKRFKADTGTHDGLSDDQVDELNKAIAKEGWKKDGPPTTNADGTTTQKYTKNPRLKSDNTVDRPKVDLTVTSGNGTFKMDVSVGANSGAGANAASEIGSKLERQLAPILKLLP